MNYEELIERLLEIHDEHIAPPTAEALALYDENGFHNPCGCSICRLIDDLTIEKVLKQAEDSRSAG